MNIEAVLMVWARTKLMIWDYLFEPVKQIKITYAGKEPGKLYKKINELIRTTINVPDAYIQERDYSWEKLRDAEKFEVGWDVNKLFDLFSYIYIEIDLRGSSANGEGRAVITIRPRLITEYPQDTIWQQSIVYEMLRRTWHRIFYQQKRVEYLNTGKELLINFENALKRAAEQLRE